MEQILVPGWLADAVMAAGMTTVYNADDWSHGGAHARPAGDEPAQSSLN